jgi:hypothetical protein
MLLCHFLCFVPKDSGYHCHNCLGEGCSFLRKSLTKITEVLHTGDYSVSYELPYHGFCLPANEDTSLKQFKDLTEVKDQNTHVLHAPRLYIVIKHSRIYSEIVMVVLSFPSEDRDVTPTGSALLLYTHAYSDSEMRATIMLRNRVR